MKKSEFRRLLNVPLRKKDENEPSAQAMELLTVRGKKVRVPNVSAPKFDEKTGTLHTPRGSFKVYLPQHDKLDPEAGQKFENILNDPKASAFHEKATRNWLKLHQALKAGALPPDVIKHATLFSMLSPQTAVPMQELMYAHLLDSMKHTGIDATDPRFAERGGAVEKDWAQRDQPHALPESSRSYFAPGGPANKMLTVVPDKKEGVGKRGPGEMQPFSMPVFKFNLLSNYPAMHQHLTALLSKHGHDARGMVREMMDEKRARVLHDAKRERGIKAGKGDIGEYPGAFIAGVAPKTARYAVAMAGGGNVHVPDTHFIRHMFGLEQRTDGKASEYLKSVLWNENQGHLLDSIDKHYFKHHPAVAWMLKHPEFGQHFQGQNAENALFPAFWKHWVSIVPHEQSRGMYAGGMNEGTDHTPYWDAVMPYVKSESPDTALRHVKTHLDWAKKYGEIPASMLYYAYIVPQLMGDKKEPAMNKAESMRIINAPLRKAAPAVVPVETEHPALVSKDGMPAARFGIVTADEPKHPVLTPGGNEALEVELKQRGHRYEPVEGRYEDPSKPERSFLIHGIGPEELVDLGHRYGQDSVVYTDGEGRNKLIYSNGPDKGKFVAGRGWGHGPADTHPESYYSTVMHNDKPRHFSLGLNFDNGTFDNDDAAFSGPKLVEKSMRKSESLRLIRTPLRKEERAAIGHKGVGIGRIRVIHPDGTKKDPGPSAVRANAGKMKVRHNDGGVSERSMRAGQVRDEEGNPVSPKSRNRAKERA